MRTTRTSRCALLRLSGTLSTSTRASRNVGVPRNTETRRAETAETRLAAMRDCLNATGRRIHFDVCAHSCYDAGTRHSPACWAAWYANATGKLAAPYQKHQLGVPRLPIPTLDDAPCRRGAFLPHTLRFEPRASRTSALFVARIGKRPPPQPATEEAAAAAAAACEAAIERWTDPEAE